MIHERTITWLTCDGCRKPDNEAPIISTFVAAVGFGGKTIMQRALTEEFYGGRKRRDYCEECVEADRFYCERCHKPHQFECPEDAAQMDAENAAWEVEQAALMTDPEYAARAAEAMALIF